MVKTIPRATEKDKTLQLKNDKWMILLFNYLPIVSVFKLAFNKKRNKQTNNKQEEETKKNDNDDEEEEEEEEGGKKE